MNNNQYSPKLDDNNAINIRAELEKYLIHWKWFILGVVVSLTLAFLNLRYSTPKYSATTTILIKNEQKGGLSGELAAFQDLGIVGSSGKNIGNEIQIIKSRKLIFAVIEKLKLNIKYMIEGRVKESEIYRKKPIAFVLNDNSSPKKLNAFFNVQILSNEKFRLLDAKGNTLSDNLFNEPVSHANLASFKIIKTTSFNNKSINTNIKILISPIKNVVNSYQGRIIVEPISRGSSVLKLSLQSTFKEKSQDILDELVTQYNKDAINDKKEVSEKTNNFIIERLNSIGKELAKIDDNIETFKDKNNITDIQSEAQLTLQINTETNQKLIEATTELNLAKSLNDELNNNDYLPSNLGLSDQNIAQSIKEYNQFIAQLKRLEKSAGTKNTALIQVQEDISNLKNSLKRSLANSVRSIQLKVNSLQRESNRYSSKISSIPNKERKFLDITRKQQIIAGLYSYLLNKKEETAISLTATAVPNAKIIDKAYGSSTPVSPKIKITYLIALLFGISIPFIVIYLRDLLDTKVHTKKDIEELTTIPFLGDIPHSETKEKIVINASARSSTAESFRLIRTNLGFMLPQKTAGQGKTIFVTSTTSGEGKSFTSINLAASLSLSGKKVILVGMDLRAPKITEYLDLPDRKGITNFITNNDITLDSLKFNIDEISNLDIIASGAIPPNPAELLMTEKISSIFSELQDSYDYVIIDTAPVNLVTDTLLIAKYADIILYVARANYLDKRMLVVPQSLYKDKKLPNLAIVLNDTDMKRGYGYAYGYGYGYGLPEEDTKPWYKKIFS